MLGSLTSLILVLLLAIVYLLYCIRPSEGTTMAKIRTLALHDFPVKLGQIGDKIFGPKFGKTLVAARNYLFFTNNPLVMYFYVVVAVGCYLLYIQKVLVAHSEFINSIDAVAGNIAVMTTFYFFFKAVKTPATIVSKHNNEVLVQKYRDFYDGTVFVEGVICQTCKVTK